MKALLIFVTACSMLASTNEFHLPSVKIGTNEYRKAVITRRNALEAVVRYDGGITKAKIADLPEPMRSTWLDEEAAKKLEEERKEQTEEGQKANKVANDARNTAMVQANYRTVSGVLVPIASFGSADGVVEQQVNGGLLVRKPHYERVKVGTKRGAFGLQQDNYDRREVPGSGVYKFIRNAPANATGKHVYVRAYNTGKTIKIRGVDAELWDCGTVPKPAKPPVLAPKLSGTH